MRIIDAPRQIYRLFSSDRGSVEKNSASVSELFSPSASARTSQADEMILSQSSDQWRAGAGYSPTRSKAQSRTSELKSQSAFVLNEAELDRFHNDQKLRDEAESAEFFNDDHSQEAGIIGYDVSPVKSLLIGASAFMGVSLLVLLFVTVGARRAGPTVPPKAVQNRLAPRNMTAASAVPVRQPAAEPTVGRLSPNTSPELKPEIQNSDVGRSIKVLAPPDYKNNRALASPPVAHFKTAATPIVPANPPLAPQGLPSGA